MMSSEVDNDFCIREDELAKRWHCTVRTLAGRRKNNPGNVPLFTQPGGPGTRILYSLSSVRQWELDKSNLGVSDEQ